MNVVLYEQYHLCPKNVQNIPPTLPNFPVDQGQPNNHIPTQNTKFHHPPSLSHDQRQHQNMNDPNGTQTSISQRNDDSTASRSQDQQYSINERPVLSYGSLVDNMGSQSTVSGNHSQYDNDDDAHYPEHGYHEEYSISSDPNIQGELQVEYYLQGERSVVSDPNISTVQEGSILDQSTLIDQVHVGSYEAALDTVEAP